MNQDPKHAYTSCWKCNAWYVMALVCCPTCKATNANIDLIKAEREAKASVTAPEEDE